MGQSLGKRLYVSEPHDSTSAGRENRRVRNPCMRAVRTRFSTRNNLKNLKHRLLAMHLQGFVTALSIVQDANEQSCFEGAVTRPGQRFASILSGPSSSGRRVPSIQGRLLNLVGNPPGAISERAKKHLRASWALGRQVAPY